MSSRFYKQPKPTFVDDIMYQPPWEMMEKGIRAEDKRLADDQATVDSFDDIKQDIKNIKVDDPAANEEIAGFRTQADEIAKGMAGDPKNHSVYARQMAELKRKVGRSMSTGKYAKLQANHAFREKDRAEIDARKDLTPEQKETAKRVSDHRYNTSGGLNYQDENTYSPYRKDNASLQINRNIDEVGFQKDIKGLLSASATEKATAGPGGDYIWKSESGDKFISAEKVDSVVRNNPAFEDWQAKEKQVIDWKMEMGEIQVPEGMTREEAANQELDKRSEKFISDTAEALSYNIHSESKSVTADSVAMQKRGLQAQAGGVGFVSTVDEDHSLSQTDIDNAATPEEKAALTQTKNRFIKIKNGLFRSGTNSNENAFADLSEIKTGLTNPDTAEATKSKIQKIADSNGYTYSQVIEYLNDTAKQRQHKSLHPTFAKDPNDPNAKWTDAETKKYAATMKENFEYNYHADQPYYRTTASYSDGTKADINIRNKAELKELEKNGNYIILDSDTKKGQLAVKDSEGYVLRENGSRAINPDTGEGYKDENKVPAALKPKYKEVTEEHKKRVQKGNFGTYSQLNNYEYKDKGRNSKKVPTVIKKVEIFDKAKKKYLTVQLEVRQKDIEVKRR